ncbi:MAG: site-2 protease family protein [Clostridia bacterium]|nr:site-2 protease family protein [Clostridia bacterium]
MQILYILAALLILSFIVMVHEFGHYLAGRLCGIGIVEFAVGMGPKIIGWERKGIKYSLRAIPIGGFCSFVGEDEENPAPNAMNKMPVWKRFVTVASGPVMNFVLAYVVCAILLANFMNTILMPRIDAVIEDMPAYEAGFQAGDVVTAIDGIEISYDNDGAEKMRSIVQAADDNTVLEFTVDRDGETVELELSPALVPVPYINAQTGEEYVRDTYQIGIQFGVRNYTFSEAIVGAGGYMVDTAKMMVEALKNLVFKGEGVDEMSGPVGIISVMSEQVKEGMYMILYLIFIISLNLGIMNLLPLPALDGGRLIFLAVEGITRKRVPPEKEGLVHALGLFLLMGLMVFITYNDIVRLIKG